MKLRLTAVILSAGLLTLGGFQFLGSSAPPAQADRDAQVRAAQGTGLDPLTSQEIDRARAAAMTGQPLARAEEGRPEVAFLYAQRLDDKDAETGPRTAEVRLYDYRTDELVIQHVDLASGKVVKTQRVRDRQPAATPDELRRATTLILADAKLGKGLRAQYQAAVGRPLGSASDLHMRGFVFGAARAAGAGNASAFRECGRHRCLQVSLKLPGGRWVDMTRIVVDMSAQQILIINY